MIKDLKIGTTINTDLLIASVAQAKTKAGKPYETIVFSDSTGRISGKLWDLVKATVPREAGKVVHVIGSVSEYEGNLQLTIDSVSQQISAKTPLDFCMHSLRPIEKMKEELLSWVDSIEDDEYRQLTSTILARFSEQFLSGSAAKSLHHATVGGLVQHTLETVVCADGMTKAFSGVNHSLVVAAALLHDIGKVQELEPFPKNIYTPVGSLMGHLVIGAETVDKIGAELGTSEEKLLLLKHCVLAHHGSKEFGSPVLPAIPEAIIVSMADNTSARVQHYFEETESLEPGQLAGSMDWMLGTALYKPTI